MSAKFQGGASLPAQRTARPAALAPTGLGAEVQATITVWARDMLRFAREPHRVLGSIAQPLLFWLLIGSGLGSTFQPRGFPEDFSYLAFFYPGMVGLTLLFTSIFSTITVINDREHGFLKEILVSPISRNSIVMGKILAGATIAVIQGILLLLLAPLAGLPLTLANIVPLLVVMAVISIGLTAMGLAVAWRMTSTQGFHMVMNLFMFPMWILSGAMFPLSGAPVVMTWLMYMNPLTYGVDALRGLLVQPGVVSDGFVNMSVPLNGAILTLLSLVLVAVALKACREDR